MRKQQAHYHPSGVSQEVCRISRNVMKTRKEEEGAKEGVGSCVFLYSKTLCSLLLSSLSATDRREHCHYCCVSVIVKGRIRKGAGGRGGGRKDTFGDEDDDTLDHDDDDDDDGDDGDDDGDHSM